MVGLEPTGHYGEAFAYWWEERHEAVVLVNPMHTRRAKELEDNSPLKSDPKDARVIAGLVAMGKYLRSHLARGGASGVAVFGAESAAMRASTTNGCAINCTRQWGGYFQNWIGRSQN